MYIGLCIVAVLQTWTIGLPILVVVRDSPSVSFYVQSGLVFVTSLAVIGFTFFPKVLAVRKDRANGRKEVYKEFKRAAILRQRAEEEDSDRDPNHAADLPITETKTSGIKVLHNPRVSEIFILFCNVCMKSDFHFSLYQSQRNLALSGGLELSRRQLQVWEDALSDENAGSDDKMEQILENEMDESNCESSNFDPLSRSFQKISEPSDDAVDHDIPDDKNVLELAVHDTGSADIDIKSAIELPPESAEQVAESTPNLDCSKIEDKEQSK
jgi:hypothetical protein